MLKEQEEQRIAALDESLREVGPKMERINGFLGIVPNGRMPNKSWYAILG